MEIKKVLVLVLIYFSLFSCEKNENSLQQKTIIVTSKKVDCEGFIPQECFLIKEQKEDNWQFLYNQIIGFNYEIGFEYVLLVSKEKIENPPQDSSSIIYTLLEVVSKEKKVSNNLPI